ncbi:hypothetical protein ASPZODRAFT_145784 [Penicilliopsis zonata CBS 506.65]|uniref:Uncharacterized protein n=1 Tax=Penicilliopsis zonata CBS 506.65 TaxID=1073090 RepID=A0A1L9S9L7_9EURO|nr:hypothetical protein ASPZODRAFT_145784 [Penicilliopsis zonata CBS 506.65]OJJ43847.1 hypothetical protein ASPZODRAFT_145784 [Penicilliopsis zonata CBS 506.65]
MLDPQISHFKKGVRRFLKQDPAPKQSTLYLPENVHELPASPLLPSPLVLTPAKDRFSSAALPTGLSDDVILLIYNCIDTLADLFSTAVVNVQFYRVFKSNELSLMKHILFKMSPPAWELREMSPPWKSEWQVLLDPDSPVPEYTPAIYLRRHAQDIYTLAQLKSLVLARCFSFLRQETIKGLAGVDMVRAAQVDDAFWRIWTFCRIFGSGKNRENDILGQVDWLEGGRMAMNEGDPFSSASFSEPFGINNVLLEPPSGFAGGNPGGLSLSQLYDMTEIWTCLGVLLQPMHGNCAEARKAGIYDGHNFTAGDTAKEAIMLEEWTSYVLSLGPSAVLCLGAVCQTDAAKHAFQKAQEIGLMTWELPETGHSRSSFFKEAVSKAFESQGRKPTGGVSVPGIPALGTSRQESRSTADRRQRQARLAAGLRKQHLRPRAAAGPSSFMDERPLSSFHVVLDRLEGITNEHQRNQRNQRHQQHHQQRHRFLSSDDHALQPAPLRLRIKPPVLDPADKAVNLIVQQFGFGEQDARWALKITDTGEQIDVNAAVSLLLRERSRRENHGRPSSLSRDARGLNAAR